MSNILVLSSSLSGAGVSDELLRHYVAGVRAADPSSSLTWRDLGVTPLPYLTAAGLPGLGGKQDTPEARATQALSDELIAELTAADTIVIGSPMYNFGIAATLKSWFDHVLRAGVTFHYTSDGPVGHLQGKRAIVVVTRGGFFSEASPLHDKDAQEPHIRAMLWFVGITDVTFIRAEKLVFGTDGVEQARTELTALAA